MFSARWIDDEWRLYFKEEYQALFTYAKSPSLPCINLSMDFEESHINIGFCELGQIFINIPFLKSKEEKSYGFYFYNDDPKKWWIFDSFWINHGKESIVIYMPWQWEWFSNSYLDKDKIWLIETSQNRQDFWDEDKWKDKLWSEIHDYIYQLESGEVQQVKATIKVVKTERRRWWLKWTNKFAKIDNCINVDFSDEVGERAGSWKGGVMGCGYSMLPNETPLECLKRMEQERKFN